MEEEEGLQTSREFSSNNSREIRSGFSGNAAGNNLSGEGSKSTTSNHNHENHNHQGHEHEAHVHGENCQHGHAHENEGSKKNRKPSKNYGIMAFIVISILVCFYLMTERFHPLIGDYFSKVFDCASRLMLFLILWSYFQTHLIGNDVPKMSKFTNHDTIGTQLIDAKYHLFARYCDRCKYYKLPRVSHCSSCGKCIYKLDHHCIWTQTCIGHCNQRAFICFIVYMGTGIFMYWVSTIRTVWYMTQKMDQAFFEVFETKIYVMWFISCISAAVLGYMVTQLITAHFLMICTNATTLDCMKRKAPSPLPFIEFRPIFHINELINTFDRGEIQNLRSLFGTNILTFWMPLKRQIENEFIIEQMNPQPTKSKLIKETPFYDWEIDVNNERYQACCKVKETYKGRKFVVDGEEFTV